ERTYGLIQSFHMSGPPEQQEHVGIGSPSEAARNEAFQVEMRCCRPRHDTWRETMDAAFAGDGIVTTAHEIQDVCPPPAITRITEVIGIEHVGEDKAARLDHMRQLFEKQSVIREMVEHRKVRRDGLHLAGERRCHRDHGFAGDFIAAVLRQVFAHRFRRFVHESRVSGGGIGLGIDTRAGTEVEHGRFRGQQTSASFWNRSRTSRSRGEASMNWWYCSPVCTSSITLLAHSWSCAFARCVKPELRRLPPATEFRHERTHRPTQAVPRTMYV